MPVTSTTLAGVNVWQFSGAVSDAEIKTAWAALIVNNRYKPGRKLYIDSTCSLANVRGTYYVDSENLGVILHSSRNKANTVFSNWIFTQTVGLSVGARGTFVQFTNGTVISTAFNDGIDMKGGGMIYAVVGNPGGGDPRYLNEMNFGSLDGTVVTSQAFAEQELQPVSYGTIWRGLNIQKCANIPIVNQGNQVVYRTNFNTEITGANPISLYSGSNGCFISTVMRKQGATFTSSLANTYASGGVTTIMILNNWKDESYFGASKTNLVATNWSAGNRIIGGVLKKIQVQPGTLIRTYDSRSTTASQKSTFSETTTDFLSGTNSTTADASTGKASIVCVGAIATGGSVAITRYTGQKFTLQNFGYKVQVETPDMTFGDDDLSAFSPITMTAQAGIVRTQAAITSATTITGFQDLLEELHVLALAQVGAASYNAYGSGNLFTFEGGKLTTNFTTVNVDATAAAKISYNSTTNTLTVKSLTMTSNETVTEWSNAGGAVNLLNGAKITGIYTSSAGTSTNLEVRNIKPGASYIVATNSTKATLLFGVNNDATAQDYTVQFPPGSAGTEIYVARKGHGDFIDFEVITLEPGLIWHTFVDIPDEGVVETNKATVLAYTTLETNRKIYEYVSAYQTTEEGIKLGNLVTRAGPLLNWSAPYSAKLKKDAPAVWAKSGNLFTIKTTSLDSDAFTTHILVPPATMTADTDEIISTNIEDANGNSSLTVRGGDNLGYKLWKVPASLPVDGDPTTGTLLATVDRNDVYRFIGITGFDIIGVDQSSGVKRRTSMAKGIYSQTFYVGDEIQLADEAPQLIENNEKLAVLQVLTTDLQEQIDALQVLVNALPQTGDIVDANIVKVNGVAVDGTGSESDPWGPV